MFALESPQVDLDFHVTFSLACQRWKDQVRQNGAVTSCRASGFCAWSSMWGRQCCAGVFGNVPWLGIVSPSEEEAIEFVPNGLTASHTSVRFGTADLREPERPP